MPVEIIVSVQCFRVSVCQLVRALTAKPLDIWTQKLVEHRKSEHEKCDCLSVQKDFKTILDYGRGRCVHAGAFDVHAGAFN